MSANNVIQGPWGSLAPASDDKDVATKVNDDFIFLMNVVMNHMEKRGIDTLDEDEYIKDLALIAESIRSYLYKVRGKYHPCQDISDNLFYFNMGKLNMQTSLIVEFK